MQVLAFVSRFFFYPPSHNLPPILGLNFLEVPSAHVPLNPVTTNALLPPSIPAENTKQNDAEIRFLKTI
jgi:hypothetical protein